MFSKYASCKGMQAVNVCSCKILHFLTGGDGQHRLICMMVRSWNGYVLCVSISKNFLLII